MKKKFFIALVAIATIAAMASCKTRTEVDPIHGTLPVDTTWWSGTPSVSDDGSVRESSTRFPLDQFYELGQAGDTATQRQLVNTYRKQLTANVVSHYPSITSHKNIHFYLATGYAKDVRSGDGNTYSGNFRNELIIVINDPNANDTVFLACGNGMLSQIDFKGFDYAIDFGVAEPWRFTIQKGEGLANHLPGLKAWAIVAHDLKIPIMNEKGEIVPISIYQNYLGEYTSYLFEGDVIDVLAGKVYNKFGQEADFQRRLAEAEKAAAEKAKATKGKGKKRR